MAGMPSMAGLGGARQAPKAFKDVITSKAISQKGLFTVHKVEDKYYFEIPNSLMGRQILAVTRYVKVPAVGGGRGVYGGEIANQQTMAFEKGPSSNIFLRGIALISNANPTDDIYKAVTNSNLNAIAAAFPIAAFSKDSSGVVIDVTDYFKGDNPLVSVSAQVKRSLSLTQISADRSYIDKISSYPINTEIRTVKTFGSSAAGGGFGGASPAPTASIPTANGNNAITIV
jgi:hypothetical protein